MQKPFNAEGLDLTFLFDSSYLEPSIAEAGNMELDLNAMPGFTPEQTSSLQRMLSRVIGEALDPLLKPLGEFLSAWDKSSPSVSVNTSSNRTSSPSLGFDHAIDPATGTSFATGPSNMGDGVATSSSISTDIRAVETVRPSSGDRVPAKRKATALDEAVIPAAKKECRFGLVGKETTLDPISNGYSTEVQVKEEYTPETLLHTSHPSSTEEDDESLFLSTAPSQFDSQPASSHGQVMGEYSTDTKSVEEQPEPAVRFAESSALLKVLFQNEPRIDKACPTRDYFAEKPASLAHPPNIYGRSFPRLPYDAPRGCAHIIDVTRFHTNKTRSSIRMADLIVTFLFYYCPDLLYAFLNVNRHPEFSFSRIEAVNGGRRDFSTERTGLIVTVSSSFICEE